MLDFDSTSPAFAARTRSLGGKGPAIKSVRDMIGGGHGGPAVQPCLFLLFPDGDRPDAADVRAALLTGSVGEISWDSAASGTAADSSDWLEVLVDGLTFDLLGLAPGTGLNVPEPRYRFGVGDAPLAGSAAIGLAPGPHLAGAASAMPVVRTLLRLGSSLAAQWPAMFGAMWLPARSVMRRDLFVSAIEVWLAGGPFPALGLTSVAERPEGELASDGLAFFTGQELVLEAGLSADRVVATQLLTRLIDGLVASPPLAEPVDIGVEGGRAVRLVPSGSVIRVTSA